MTTLQRILAMAVLLIAVPNLALAQAAVPKATTPAAPAAPAGVPKAAPAAPAATPAPAAAAGNTKGGPPPALPPATKLPTPVIGVVDSTYVLSNAAATKAVNAQLQSISAVFSQEIAKLEDDLRNRDQELTRQQAIMAPDAYKARRAEFDAALDNAQKLVEQRNGQLDKAYNDAMGKVHDEMIKVLAEISQQRGVNLVLEQTTVVFNAPALDLSRDVINGLDIRLPKVDVPNPPAP